MTNSSLGLLATLTLVASAGLAAADDAPVMEGSVDASAAPMGTRTTARTEIRDERERGSIVSGIGVAVTAGAGAGGFTNTTLRNNTEAGGNWDVRVTIGTELPIALEASYIGSAQYLDTFGLNNDALLIGNGAQGAVRINVLGGAAVSPFVFGGAAWRRYKLTAVDTNMSVVADGDNVLEIPMGAGLGLRTGNLILDLRGEYRVAFKEDLLPSAGDDDGASAPMNRWGATFNAGLAF